METLSWLCLFLPLAGVVVLALAGNRIGREPASWLATAIAFASFICAAAVFFSILGEGESARSHVYTLYTWAGAHNIHVLHVPLSIQVDQLSVVEMLIVSGVGALIVMYSIGYMHGDPKQRRFFAYLDLFLFSMLLLVMAGNFVLLLAGWGMVGLSSYLLIGFWHEQEAPVAAAKKAFVMNTIGDVGIAIAIFFMVRDIGTTNYHEVFTRAHDVWPKGSSDANWVALLLLVGAVAKSAQIPLHTWLPDAMEGPTPVSALIHAATMVTAGVYLIARCHVLFANAPNVRTLVAVIGVATLLMAGVIALVQTDIKRIIAYSTMSQIGYMFAAVGVADDSAGMFHLLTHAFFKALLFLGAGIVIHALANEQDVRRMGGLSKVMPRTTALMWVGTIALIGFWPLSKDAILEGALHGGGTAGWIVYVGGLVGAAFTGIYATRLMRLVFYGEMSDYAKEHLHSRPRRGAVDDVPAGGGAGGRCGAGRVPLDRLWRHELLRRLPRADRAHDRGHRPAGHPDDGAGLGPGRSRRAVRVAAVRRSGPGGRRAQPVPDHGHHRRGQVRLGRALLQHRLPPGGVAGRHARQRR